MPVEVVEIELVDDGEEEVEQGRQTADEGILCFYGLSERYKCSPNEAQDAKDNP